MEEKDLIEISLGKRPLVSTVISRSSSLVSDLDGSQIDDDNAPIIPVAKPNRPKIPFKAIFTSVPFYAILIAHCTQNWGFYTLLNEMPTYMSQILHFNIKEVHKSVRQNHRSLFYVIFQNAFLSSLPYLCMWLVAIFSSQVADYVRSRGILSTTATRKILNSIGETHA